MIINPGDEITVEIPGDDGEVVEIPVVNDAELRDLIELEDAP